MKTVVKLKNLINAVSICSRAIQSRNSVEVLANILITTQKNTLVIQSTNLEIAIQTELGAKVEQEGGITVPARIFLDLIQSFSEDTVQLIADKDNLTIKSDYSHTRINGTPVSDFPTLPSLDIKQTITIAREKLQQALAGVIVCTSSDETRPVLAGVCMQVKDKIITLAATDSYRLAETIIPTNVTNELVSIVPAKTLLEVSRLITNEENTNIEIGLTENEIQFQIGKTVIISQLTEGKYPDYKKIFPETYQTTLQINKSQLIESVKVNSLFAKESSHGLTLTIQKSQLILTAKSSDIGENSSKVIIQKKGKDTEISLNAQYLLDALTVITTKEVELKLNDKLDPCVIVPVVKNANYTHVIMPLRS